MDHETFASHDGLRLSVRILGSGPPLVVVPGWLGAYSDWSPVTRRLADRHTCYVWESRPYVDAATPTIDRMAADLRSMIKAFALERPVILGHSMGALTCWEYVRRFGCADIGAFCLVDQAPRMVTGADWSLGLEGGFPPEANRAFIDWMWRDFPSAAMDLVARSRRAPPGSGAARLEAMFRDTRRQRIESLQPAAWIRAWESFSWQDYRGVLSQVEVPTLLVYGAQSFYGLEVARYVYRRMPDARLRIHAVAGHSPHQDDLPGFLGDLRQFTAGDGIYAASPEGC